MKSAETILFNEIWRNYKLRHAKCITIGQRISAMNTDDIINTFKDKLRQQPSLESVEGDRESTLKKVFTSKTLANLKDRIIMAYQILSDVSRGRRKVPASKIALLASGLAYLALPLDLVCDTIPVAGLVDDGIVLAWIFTRCADLFNETKARPASGACRGADGSATNGCPRDKPS